MESYQGLSRIGIYTGTSQLRQYFFFHPYKSVMLFSAKQSQSLFLLVLQSMPPGDNMDMSKVLWQPLITKTNDYTNGKSLSWISSGEFIRELDKESLLN